jgi:hypothetical protein
MKPAHPQRLSPPAQPGALLKRAFAIAQRIKLKAIGDSDPVYLAMVRQMPCLGCGVEPCGEAAHIRYNSGAHGKHNGMGKRPADRYVAPLCGGCHREDNSSQHKVGERAFWSWLAIDPLLIAEKLYAARGDIVKMRAVVMVAIAERGERD